MYRDNIEKKKETKVLRELIAIVLFTLERDRANLIKLLSYYY